jgi:hypothetical protein
MRLSSVVVAVILFFSPAALAQHSSGGGGSSSSGSSGGSSHSSSGGGSSGGSSHASSSSGGSNHSAGTHSSAGSHSSNAHNSGSNSSSHNSAASSGSRSNGPPARSGTVVSRGDNTRTTREPVRKPVQAKENAASAKTAQPAKRSFFSFLRHPFHKSPKPAEADLRRPVCKGEDCKKPMPKPPAPAPVFVESDLRRPICKGKACQCPSGETPGKNGGCVVAPTINGPCAAGQSSIGGACVAASHQCQANEHWNGTSCVLRQADCATIEARAASLTNEVRGAKTQMQNGCSNSSAGQDCSALKQNYDGAVERYRMLLNEAAPNCRSMLVDPLSL